MYRNKISFNSVEMKTLMSKRQTRVIEVQWYLILSNLLDDGKLEIEIEPTEIKKMRKRKIICFYFQNFAKLILFFGF